LTPYIAIDHLTVVYRDIPALWDVSVTFPKGKTISVVGPNGAGKSTLLKTILGLVDKQSGSIKIDGVDHLHLKDRHKKIAYVPQRDSIDWNFPTTVLDVVMMGRYGHLGWFKRPGAEEKRLAMDALTKFEMDKYADRQINELSGGQKQRILLARSYVQDAEIYFLDEPFGGVDTKTETKTLELLAELKEKEKTIIVVTHDLQSLVSYFDFVLLLRNQLVACGSPKEVITQEFLTKAYGGQLHLEYGEMGGENT
jgi:manganese/zinc/iron transport system ATP- binding protein